MKKRSLAILLAIVMMITSLTALVGCNNVSTDTDESKETPTISILYADNASYPILEDWAVIGWIEEAANVKLDLTVVPEADWAVKKEVVFNSGSIPDLVPKTFATSADVSAEVLLPISQYEDQMPNFVSYLDTVGARTALDATRFSDGNYYTMPAKARTSQLQDQQWIVREDIFVEHDIKIPTTLDEIYDAGVKLKELYPDSTPITNRFTGNNILTAFAGAFGTIAGWTIGDGMHYDYDNDVWNYAPTTENFKQMLIYVNKLVNAGVLDKEYSTLDSTTYEQRAIQGDTFMLYDWVINIKKYEALGVENNPNYNMTPIYPPKGGVEGKYAISWKQYWDQGYVLPASLADDEEHLAEVLAYLNWGFTEEAEIITSFGKEGVSYVVDESGHLVQKDNSVDNAVAFGLNNNSFVMRQHMDVIIYSSITAEEVALFEQITADGIVPIPNPQSPLTPDELEETQVYTTTLLDYVNSSMEKFIFGAVGDVEAGWDAYVAECESKGSLDLAKLYNN